MLNSLIRNPKTIRFLSFIPLILFQGLIYSQTSLPAIDLQQGAYRVGFQHYTLIDSTRSYLIKNEFNHQAIYRPIPVSIWYPAEKSAESAKPLTVLNYLEILKAEEEWEHLPNEFLLDWFPYLWNTPENQAHLPEQTHAFADAPALAGEYPVIIYTPSYQASSIENFALCEYLVSHGFVVIASPSRGTSIRELEGGTPRDMETQSRDVECLLQEIHQYENIDPNRIALMGFSFGGLSNAITVMKHLNISALVSLDGTERYNYAVLEQSPYYELDKFAIPYVHFAQKNIPEAVMAAENMPETLNSQFQLYDSLRYSDVYRYKFHDLTHAYFSSYGVLFANRDKRQDKSDDKIMRSYRLLAEHTLQFLKATLKEDQQAKAFMENRPSANGFEEGLVSQQRKQALEQAFDYKDFNDLAVKQNYQELIALYEQTLAQHPSLKLDEYMLNTLGLRLSFDPEKGARGIRVLLLALHIYPGSSNLYDSLAEAYWYNKDYPNAKRSFEKALALDPENQHAKDRLEQLKE